MITLLALDFGTLLSGAASMREAESGLTGPVQGWMIEQFGTYLASKGRRLIGWDEILEGGLPASASVMSWRGEQGGIDAANMGHDVVMSPGNPLYLNGLQSRRSDEPPGRLDITTLQQVYAYDPLPKGIAADKALYGAKESGRNCVVIATTSAPRAASKRR